MTEGKNSHSTSHIPGSFGSVLGSQVLMSGKPVRDQALNAAQVTPSGWSGSQHRGCTVK